MEIHSLLLLVSITLLAYILKGLTGFGPALLVVPFFTIVAGVKYALPASAAFDAIAGLILLLTIYKQISWKFCLPLMIAMGAGSFLGAKAVFVVPANLIRMSVGIFIFIFGAYLLVGSRSSESRRKTISGNESRRLLPGAIIAGFLGGISGGLVGISGPILVIYLKYYFSKDFFRTQLIAIFLIENIVRLLIYFEGGLLEFQETNFLIACMPALLIGLWVGHKFHLRISELYFNRIVSAILILVSVKIVLF